MKVYVFGNEYVVGDKRAIEVAKICLFAEILLALGISSAYPDKWVVNGYALRYETTNLRASYE